MDVSISKIKTTRDLLNASRRQMSLKPMTSTAALFHLLTLSLLLLKPQWPEPPNHTTQMKPMPMVPWQEYSEISLNLEEPLLNHVIGMRD